MWENNVTRGLECGVCFSGNHVPGMVDKGAGAFSKYWRMHCKKEEAVLIS